MSEPKPLASLSSSLLARKGGAKPAMRRQGMAFPTGSDHENEDLGWNDMGYDTNPDHEAVQPGAHNGEEVEQYHYNPLAGAIPEVVPAVRKQQEEIAAKLSQHPTRQEEAAAAPEPKALKLRLATAVKNVSAQQLVTKAVDEYLKSIPELEDLAGRIPSRGAA